MTVDELMKQLEAIPYFAELRIAAMTSAGFREGSLAGIGTETATKRRRRIIRRAWIVSNDLLHPVSAPLWLP